MPNRTIRESARTSATLDTLSHGAERLFWRLTTVADDYGRFEADPRLLRAGCFPLRVEKLKISTIEAWYAELTTCCLVTAYVVTGKTYGFFTTWEKHQRIRAQHSKHPAPTPDNICCHLLASAAEHRTSNTTEQRTANSEQEALSGSGARPRAELREQAEEILRFLNEKAGRSFRPVDANLRLIEARLRSGATVENCHGVIARKVREWNGDAKMAAFLRPSTLFNAEKFESYLGQKPSPPMEG